MFGMGFRLLSALDFSEDVRGSETVQKLNNSAVFNPSVISSLKANTNTDLLDLFFSYYGVSLKYPHTFIKV